MKYLHSIVLVMMIGFQASADAQINEKFTSKSSTTGVSLSLVGTLAPAAVGATVLWAGAENSSTTLRVTTGVTLVVGGAIFGPGVGHKYAGNSRRFWIGAGLRTLGAGAFAAMGAIGLSDTILSDEGSPWEFGAAVAATLTGISVIYDIATVNDSVDEYNRKHGPGRFSLSPTVDLARGGAGVRLSWKF